MGELSHAWDEIDANAVSRPQSRYDRIVEQNNAAQQEKALIRERNQNQAQFQTMLATAHRLNAIGQQVLIGEELLPFEVPLPEHSNDFSRLRPTLQVRIDSATCTLPTTKRGHGFFKWTNFYEIWLKLPGIQKSVEVYRLGDEPEDAPWRLEKDFQAYKRTHKEHLIAEWKASQHA